MPDAMERRVSDLENGQRDHGHRINALEIVTGKLEADLSELRVVLPMLATKADVNSAINGILRDALNAVPVRYAIVSLGTIVALIGLVLTFIHFNAP
ncbi:MAG: hypothetical protein ACREDC_00130 [Bradyrhizobium sp.]